MENTAHLARLRESIAARDIHAWNNWMEKEPDSEPGEFWTADLRWADLIGAYLSSANLSRANLKGANLSGADLSGANLSGAHMPQAKLTGANLTGADLSGATLNEADLSRAHLMGANLRGASLCDAALRAANLMGARLSRAKFANADFTEADLRRANLIGADLMGTNFREANLTGANLAKADLCGARFVETILESATFSGSRVCEIFARSVNLDNAVQSDLVISDPDEPVITVDGLEMAQFIHLLFRNRRALGEFDAVNKKGVLLLGCFADGKIMLEAIKRELRRRGFQLIVVDFEYGARREFTQTLMALIGVSQYIIADIIRPEPFPAGMGVLDPDLSRDSYPARLRDWFERVSAKAPDDYFGDNLIVLRRSDFEDLVGRLTTRSGEADGALAVLKRR